MVVSSYFIGSDQRNSWIELLVTGDNVDARQWKLGDYHPNGGGHLQNYSFITFKNISYWQHLRRGTIIVLFCRRVNASNIPYQRDTNAADGFIQITAQDLTLFDNTPANIDTKLNFHLNNEKVHLIDKNGDDIHSLGHGTNHSNFLLVDHPKLINNQVSAPNYQVQVAPGSSILEYDNTQEDTIRTNQIASNFTQGLPNQRSGWLVSNSNFWRNMREPIWPNPSLEVKTNASRTSDTLRWSLAFDPYPSDSVQGYLILKSETGVFSEPTDGISYTVGNIIGSNQVIAVFNSSQVQQFVHTHPLACNKIYYRIYAFRYQSDQLNGNNYHIARGRAYNQTSFAAGSSNRQNPIPTLFHF